MTLICLSRIVALLLGLHSLACFGFPLNTLQKRESRTSPPSGAVIVRRSGTQSGEYATISAAVAALGSSSSARTIFIYPGTYSEQVHITYPGALTIYGYTTDTSSYSANQVTITAGATSAQAGGNDASGTLRVAKNNFALYNVNVVNSYGNSASHTQAVALSAYGSQQGYYACSLTGYQDTLLANTGTQFYGRTRIAGGVDFIFGQTAVAWFDGCTITPLGTGWITANGRDSDSNPSWYVFNRCTVTSGGASAGTAYLGRPWRNYARVVFQQTSLSNVVNAAGWAQWSSSTPNTDHVTFAEYQNSGSGASTSSRASFSSRLSSARTISGILGSSYTNWVDTAYLS